MPTTDSQPEHWERFFALAPRDPRVFAKKLAERRREFVLSIFDAMACDPRSEVVCEVKAPVVDPLLVMDAVQLWLLRPGPPRKILTEKMSLAAPEWEPVHRAFAKASVAMVRFVASQARPHPNESVLYSLARALRMDERDFSGFREAVHGLHPDQAHKMYQVDLYHAVSAEISKERRAMRDRPESPKCIRLAVFVALSYNLIMNSGTKQHLLYLITQLLEENPRDYRADPFLDDFVLIRTQELKYELAHF